LALAVTASSTILSGRSTCASSATVAARLDERAWPSSCPPGERESLRQHLRANLAPAAVLEAVQRSLGGGNESARVAAVKFLADLELYRKEGDECPRWAAMKAEGPAAREHLFQMIARYVEAAVRAELVEQPFEQPEKEGSSQADRLIRGAVMKGLKGHEEELEASCESAFRKIIDSLSGGWRSGDVTAEEAARTLEELAERGLFDGRLEGRVEELAQGRLKVLKAEHGIPA
jgi:soluble lytic murein transglycosylase-like protein